MYPLFTLNEWRSVRAAVLAQGRKRVVCTSADVLIILWLSRADDAYSRKPATPSRTSNTDGEHRWTLPARSCGAEGHVFSTWSTSERPALSGVCKWGREVFAFLHRLCGEPSPSRFTAQRSHRQLQVNFRLTLTHSSLFITLVSHSSRSS